MLIEEYNFIQFRHFECRPKINLIPIEELLRENLTNDRKYWTFENARNLTM